MDFLVTLNTMTNLKVVKLGQKIMSTAPNMGERGTSETATHQKSIIIWSNHRFDNVYRTRHIRIYTFRKLFKINWSDFKAITEIFCQFS